MSLSLALNAAHVKADLKKLKMGLSRGKNFIYDFVPQNELHITLCSLPEEDIDLEEIRKFLMNIPPLELKLHSIGAYPHSKEARLLWIGVPNTKEIRELRGELLGILNIDEGSDDYRPILPVVRLKNYRSVSDLISPFKNTDFGKVLFPEVSLMEMTSHGPFPSFKIKESIKLHP